MSTRTITERNCDLCGAEMKREQRAVVYHPRGCILYFSVSLNRGGDVCNKCVLRALDHYRRALESDGYFNASIGKGAE